MIGDWSLIFLPLFGIGAMWVWMHLRRDRAVALMAVAAIGAVLLRLGLGTYSLRYCLNLNIFYICGVALGWMVIRQLIRHRTTGIQADVVFLSLVLVVCLLRLQYSLSKDKPYLREYPLAIVRDVVARKLKHPLVLVSNKTGSYLTNYTSFAGQVFQIEREKELDRLLDDLTCAYDGVYLVTERPENVPITFEFPFKFGETIYSGLFRKKIIAVRFAAHSNLGTLGRSQDEPVEPWRNNDFRLLDAQVRYPLLLERGYHLPGAGWPVAWRPGHYWHKEAVAGAGAFLGEDPQQGAFLSLTAGDCRITVVHQDAVGCDSDCGIFFRACGKPGTTFNLFILYRTAKRRGVLVSRNFGVDEEWRNYHVSFSERDFKGIAALREESGTMTGNIGWELASGTLNLTGVGTLRYGKTSEGAEK